MLFSARLSQLPLPKHLNKIVSLCFHEGLYSDLSSGVKRKATPHSISTILLNCSFFSFSFHPGQLSRSCFSLTNAFDTVKSHGQLFLKEYYWKGWVLIYLASQELVYQIHFSFLEESPLECFRGSLGRDSNGHQMEKSNTILLSNIFVLIL